MKNRRWSFACGLKYQGGVANVVFWGGKGVTCVPGDLRGCDFLGQVGEA